MNYNVDYETGEVNMNLMTTFCPALKSHISERYVSDTHEFTVYRFENGYGMHVFKSYSDRRDILEGIPVMFPDEKTTRMQSIFESNLGADVLDVSTPEELFKKLAVIRGWEKGQYLR